MKKTTGRFCVFIIGLGQIGGSLGLDLMASSLTDDIYGYDLADRVSGRALELGAISKIANTIKSGISSADIVILATPIRETARILPEVCRLAGSEKTIIDVATNKSEIFATLGRVDQAPDYFSCHPLAGTEKEGIESARKGLFKNSDFLIIPAGSAKETSHNVIRQLAEVIAARPIYINAAEHDYNVAMTIGLPYAIAVGLSGLAIKELENHAKVYKSLGGSYRSAIRVARSSPTLTLDIFLTNRANISEMITAFITELKNLDKLIRDHEEIKLADLIERTKTFGDSVCE